MSRRASVWTPRKTRCIWANQGSLAEALKFVPSSHSRWSFAPSTNHGNAFGVVPKFPMPRMLGRQRAVAVEKLEIPSEELLEIAELLRGKATALEEQTEIPSVELQLGFGLLDGLFAIARCLKDWDTRGKGEIIKGGMRNNLRHMGLQVSGVDADALFDSWDADKGGTLDLEELRVCLQRAQERAQAKRDAPDPLKQRAQSLRHKARIAEQAAHLADEADALEEQLAELTANIAKRADVRLGTLLQARMVKPAAVVTHWSNAKGEHAGELSRLDFRKAVLRLFKSHGSSSGARDGDGDGDLVEKTAYSPRFKKTPLTPAQQQLELAKALMSRQSPRCSTPEEQALAREIDSVFLMFDADNGGYLDEAEAKAMIKTLQGVANASGSELRTKQVEARVMRARANKLGLMSREAIEQMDAMDAMEA